MVYLLRVLSCRQQRAGPLSHAALYSERGDMNGQDGLKLGQSQIQKEEERSFRQYPWKYINIQATNLSTGGGAGDWQFKKQI